MIPVTILTGFLGAGKTTLLNNILHGEHGLRAAVLVNDFGSINIDSELIVGVEGEAVSLANGCICCTIRDDLVRAMLQMVERSEPPEYILVETSGVSDPTSVAASFLLPELRSRVRIDSILTVVDGEQVLGLHGSDAILAADQVASADMIVLNKVDLAEPGVLENVRAWIHEVAPKARVFETAYANIPLELALGVGGYDIAANPGHLSKEVHVHEVGQHSAHSEEGGAGGHSHPNHSLVYHTWTYGADQPCYLKSLRKRLETLPSSVFRVKGFVYLADQPANKVLVQVVGRRVQISMDEPWNGQTPQTRLVMIAGSGGLDADWLQKELDACQDPSSARLSLKEHMMEFVRSVWGA